MARVEDSSAAAALRILGRAEVADSGSGAASDRLQGLLQSFYAMAQLTHDVPIPEEVVTRVTRRLADAADGTPRAEIRRAASGGRSVTGFHTANDSQSFIRRVFLARVRVPTTAMVMLVVALGLSTGASLLLSRGVQFRPETAIFMAGTGSSRSARGVVLLDGTQIVLHADGLAELTSGYRYVAWSASGADIRYLGSLTMLQGGTGRLLTSWKTPVPGVVVTIEPSASPTSPSGPQILVGIAFE